MEKKSYGTKYFKTVKGYRFDRRIFWGVSVAIFLYAIVAVILYGNTYHVTLKCRSDAIGGYCDNPLYTNGVRPCQDNVPKEICDMPLLPAGYTYGEPSPIMVEYASFIIFFIVFLGFLINHLMYNETRFFRGE